MINLDLILILVLIGLTNANAMSIKRSENSEKIDESDYRVNYDVYPVRGKKMS